jgi:ubiquinone/menaquinone biosynthesis C-methylase UbiE
MSTKQGHWVLARLGKRVLRPGGKELTSKLIDYLDIGTSDDIVEFAPGLGHTTAVALRHNPKSYTGVELNEEAAARLRTSFAGVNRRIVTGNAASSTLPDESVDKVYGEAMLTMQTDAQKSAIIREAHRILKKGGRYGIHELGLIPDDMPVDQKTEIRKELARSIRVNARPLTLSEWTKLLEEEGFRILEVGTAPMLLLEAKRVVADEGVRRAMKILFNAMIYPKERKHALAMRETFKRHKDHLNAVAIVVEKR